MVTSGLSCLEGLGMVSSQDRANEAAVPSVRPKPGNNRGGSVSRSLLLSPPSLLPPLRQDKLLSLKPHHSQHSPLSSASLPLF